MSKIENVFVEKLRQAADAEQDIANQRYRVSDTRESYLTPHIASLVLTKVANCLEQAQQEVIMQQAKYRSSGQYIPSEGFTMPTDQPARKFGEADMFRKKLQEMVWVLKDHSLEPEAMKLWEQADELLDKNPISNLSVTNSKLCGLLREAKKSLEHTRTFISSRQKMHPDGVALQNNLIEEIERVLD